MAHRLGISFQNVNDFEIGPAERIQEASQAGPPLRIERLSEHFPTPADYFFFRNGHESSILEWE